MTNPSDAPLPSDRSDTAPRDRSDLESAETGPIEQHETFPDTATDREGEALTFATDAARLLQDDKCDDIVLLDVRRLSQVTDFIVIASGTSDRQMRSALRDVESLGAERGFPSFRSSSDERAVWVLADCVDVVVHIFEPNARSHYDLEMLWGDAERLAWSRDGGPAPGRNFAGAKPEDFEPDGAGPTP
ncbi:MAG: ribosome silencing factor [Planctomycetota bacterium]